MRLGLLVLYEGFQNDKPYLERRHSMEGVPALTAKTPWDNVLWTRRQAGTLSLGFGHLKELRTPTGQRSLIY
jgi:hypothetical protein